MSIVTCLNSTFANIQLLTQQSASWLLDGLRVLYDETQICDNGHDMVG